MPFEGSPASGLRYLALRMLGGFAAGLTFASPASAETDWSASYTGEWATIFSGGLQRGDAYLDQLELSASWDDAAENGWRGYLSGLYNNGGSISAKVGDSHVLSNIETLRAVRVFEAWVEWQHAPDRGVRVGLYDLNSEFDALETGALFLNSTFGIGLDIAQSGVTGPSIFPLTSLGVRGRWRFDEAWRVQAVVLDGVPGDPDSLRRNAIDWNSREGLLSVVELEHRRDDIRTLIGHWRYSAAFDRLDLVVNPLAKSPARGNEGMYVAIESPVWKSADGESQVDIALRAGWASAAFNDFDRTWQATIVWRPPFRVGLETTFGVGLAWARPSQRVAADIADESLIELTSQIRLTERWAIQPSLQFVRHPGATRAIADGSVVLVRSTWQLR